MTAAHKLRAANLAASALAVVAAAVPVAAAALALAVAAADVTLALAAAEPSAAVANPFAADTRTFMQELVPGCVARQHPMVDQVPHHDQMLRLFTVPLSIAPAIAAAASVVILQHSLVYDRSVEGGARGEGGAGGVVTVSDAEASWCEGPRRRVEIAGRGPPASCKVV